MLNFLEKNGKILVENSKEDGITCLKIRIPKILEMADEYTKKQLTKKESTSIDTRQIIAIRDNFICQYCHKEIKNSTDLHIDHIIPKIKGGKDKYNNLVLACENCNKTKGTQLPQDIDFPFPIPRDYQRMEALDDLLNNPSLLVKYNNVFNSQITPSKISETLQIKSREYQENIKRNFNKKPSRLHNITLHNKTVQKNKILSQIEYLISQFPQDVRELISEYIELVKAENKTKKITDLRHKRILEELYNIYRQQIEPNEFKTALQITVDNIAPHPNYIKKVLKSRQERVNAQKEKDDLRKKVERQRTKEELKKLDKYEKVAVTNKEGKKRVEQIKKKLAEKMGIKKERSPP